VEDIKTTKIREAKQRAERCRDLVIDALKKADIYVNGNRLDIKEKEPSSRLNEAFRFLVEGIYIKQNYITHPFYTTDSLRELLASRDTQTVMEGVEKSESNHLALTEMSEVIGRSSLKNIPVTMRGLIEQFSKIPYGWKEYDIAGIVLTLFKKQAVRLELGGDIITSDDLNVITYVTKRDYLDRVSVKTRVKITPELLVNAKGIAKEVFGRGDLPSDEDGLMDRIQDLASQDLERHDAQNPGIKQLLDENEKNRSEYEYPGKQVLENGKKLLEQVIRIKDTKAFFDYLQNEKEALLDYEEDVQDVKKFFRNQRDIFDKAIKMLSIYEGNRSYVLDPETIRVVNDMERILRLSAPYSEIHKLPELREQFMSRFVNLLEEECKPVRASIEADREAVNADLDLRSFKDQYLEKVRTGFAALLDRLAHANNIYEAIAMQTESDRMKQRFIQSFDDEDARLATAGQPPGGIREETETYKTVRKTKNISLKTLISGTTHISSKKDLDKLLDDLRVRLEAELAEDTMIRII
jgi:hypothetical protein